MEESLKGPLTNAHSNLLQLENMKGTQRTLYGLKGETNEEVSLS